MAAAPGSLPRWKELTNNILRHALEITNQEQLILYVYVNFEREKRGFENVKQGD
jgi:hypothetical protein